MIWKLLVIFSNYFNLSIIKMGNVNYKEKQSYRIQNMFYLNNKKSIEKYKLQN